MNSEKGSENMESDQDITAKALGTDVILSWIFKYLPTSFLLSSCSFVNKYWNTKARSFIWAYRRCTPIKPLYSSVCQFFREIDELCSKMKADGRKIPFNSLKLYSESYVPINCSRDISVAETTGPLGKDFEIKYLKAFPLCQGSECSVHQPLSNLLGKEGRGRLRSFRVENVPLLGEILSQSGWDHRFAQLQEFSIRDRKSYVPPDDLSACKGIVTRLLELSPNLKRISAPNIQMLKMVPEVRYNLLKVLKFRLRYNEDMKLLQKVAKQNFGLEELTIREPPTGFQVEAHPLEENDEPVNDSLRWHFENALGQLVQNCHRSLRTITINGTYSLGQISRDPLVNLTRLKIEQLFDGTTSQILNAISSTDYERIAPNLQEMEIIINTLLWAQGIYCFYPGPDSHIECPGRNNGEVGTCSSVRKLTLDVDAVNINLPLLRGLFPNVAELELKINDTSVTYTNCLPPLLVIWELWPLLEQLVITGGDNYLERHYDADFCGISTEEAELLMEKDDDFLRTIHIVPIRPCLLTMTNLHTMFIDLQFSEPRDEINSDRGVKFVTKVTKLVALERMSHKNVSIVDPIRPFL